METSEHLCSEAPTEPAGETSPESVHARKRRGLGLWLTQSDARYLCGHLHRATFCVAAVLPYMSLPAEKENPMSATSVLDMISSFRFRTYKKAATPHHEVQEDFPL